MSDTHKDRHASATSQDAPEIMYVAQHSIACDGGGGALGHPKVWYSLEDGEAECGYCDRRFVYDPDKAGDQSRFTKVES